MILQVVAHSCCWGVLHLVLHIPYLSLLHLPFSPLMHLAAFLQLQLLQLVLFATSGHLARSVLTPTFPNLMIPIGLRPLPCLLCQAPQD